jgi:hypothetical protein
MDVSLWLYQIIHFSRKWNLRMYLNVQREVAIAISPLAFKMPYFGECCKAKLQGTGENPLDVLRRTDFCQYKEGMVDRVMALCSAAAESLWLRRSRGCG